MRTPPTVRPGNPRDHRDEQLDALPAVPPVHLQEDRYPVKKFFLFGRRCDVCGDRHYWLFRRDPKGPGEGIVWLCSRCTS